VKPLVALAAVLVLAGCKRSESAVRRNDTTGVVPPATASGPVGQGSTDSARATGRRCGVTGVPLLTEEGIGELRPGRPVVDVAAVCEVISDSRQRGPEGMMERALAVRVAGETVRTVVEDDRIWRIEIGSPRFRTADSLGVDAPLRLIASRRGAQFAPGEDGVYAFVPDHCGLSFRFSLPLRPPAGGQWTARSISQAHGDAAVDRVLVSSCRK